MRSVVVRFVLSMLAVAGLVLLSACGGGSSPSTMAGASTSATLASDSTLQPATTGATPPASSPTSSEATGTSESPTSTSSPTVSSNTWTNLDPSGMLPTVRSGQWMAYDTDTDQVIMFGGADLSNGASAAPVVNDTWAYDPSANTWTNLDPAGTLPSACTGCSLLYSPLTHLVYMFGGYGNGSSFNDTWAYDPAANTWTNLNPAGTVPSARYSHSMVYAISTAQVIMFGGGAENSDPNDTWAYDPSANTWTNLNPAGTPSGRYDSAMAYDDNTAQVILFAGGTGQYSSFNDTWAYDSKANTWTSLNPAAAPSERTAASMVDDESTHQLIMFGGWQEQGVMVGTGFNDTWSYTP